MILRSKARGKVTRGGFLAAIGVAAMRPMG